MADSSPGSAPAQVGVKNLENMTSARLDAAARDELLSTQTECTLIFEGDDGAPAGSVLSFAWDGTSLWFTSVRGRIQIRAVERSPEVSVVVSNAGTDLDGRRMLSLRGTAQLITDPAKMEPALRLLAARLAPGGEEAFLNLLRSPNRVVVQVTPTRVIASHDSRKVAGDGRGGR